MSLLGHGLKHNEHLESGLPPKPDLPAKIGQGFVKRNRRPRGRAGEQPDEFSSLHYLRSSNPLFIEKERRWQAS